jgi:hypothetical protein
MPRQSSQAPPADASKPPTDEAAAQVQSLDFTEQVVRDVLSRLQGAIEGRKLSQVSEVFDSESAENYAALRNQFTAFFQHYDVIQFRYHILQVTSDKNLGFVTAEIDMEAAPADDSQVPLRRSTQVRFEMRLLPSGWKVVAFKPAGFFAE